MLTSDRGSLHGITLKSVLELCAVEGIAAEVAPVPRAMLEDADEVSAAATAGGVMPVLRVGGRTSDNGRPGPLSMRLKSHYWQRHKEGWHRTPVRTDWDG